MRRHIVPMPRRPWTVALAWLLYSVAGNGILARPTPWARLAISSRPSAGCSSGHAVGLAGADFAAHGERRFRAIDNGYGTGRHHRSCGFWRHC